MATPVATKPRESGRQTPAGQEVAKLLLDEPRQAFAVSKRRRLCAEGLEVCDDDLVQHALDVPQLIPLGHATRGARAVPAADRLNPA